MSFVQRINLQKQEETKEGSELENERTKPIKIQQMQRLMIPHRYAKLISSYKKEIIAQD